MIERKYRITLKDTITGDARTFETEWFGQDEEDANRNIEYLWEEGTYSCDCTRSIFLWNFDDSKHLSCGTNRIELVELEPIA